MKMWKLNKFFKWITKRCQNLLQTHIYIHIFNEKVFFLLLDIIIQKQKTIGILCAPVKNWIVGQKRQFNNQTCHEQSKLINRVMIICSKFDCSKNLLDTILLLLDTVRAIIIFLVNCSKIKNHEKSSAVRVFRAVSLLDKKILTARIAFGRQRFWKMSTTRHNL